MCVQAAAQGGATAPPSLDEVVDLHFVALVERRGRWGLLGAHKTDSNHRTIDRMAEQVIGVYQFE